MIVQYWIQNGCENLSREFVNRHNSSYPSYHNIMCLSLRSRMIFPRSQSNIYNENIKREKVKEKREQRRESFFAINKIIFKNFIERKLSIDFQTH